MTMKITTEQYFKTSDLALAATLSLFIPIESIDRSNSSRVEFQFLTNKTTEKLINQYWKGELTVEPKHFFNQLRTLKARIYDK